MDILSLAFIYARYSMNMSSITGFGMKDCLSPPSLGWKHFMSSRSNATVDANIDDVNINTNVNVNVDANVKATVDAIYSYTDKYKRHFVRQAIKGGKVGAFNQSYHSQIPDKIFTTISQELSVDGNKYETIEAYAKYIKEFKNKYEAEIISNYSD